MSHKVCYLSVFLLIASASGCTDADSQSSSTPVTTVSHEPPAAPVPEPTPTAPEPEPELEPEPDPIPEVTTVELDKAFGLRRTIEDLDRKYASYGRDKVFILRFSSYPSPEGLRQIYASIADRKESGSATSFDAFYIACALDFSIDDMIPKVTYGKVAGIDRPNGVLHIDLNQELRTSRQDFLNPPIEEWANWESVIAAGGREKCVLLLFENVTSYDQEISKVRSEILRSLDQNTTKGRAKEPFWLLGYYAGNVAELSQKIKSAEVVSVDEDAREIRVKFP